MSRASKSRPNWDEYFMAVARIVAARSTCLKRKVGAVIVKDRNILSTGYVGQPRGVVHCVDSGHCYRDSSGLEFCLSVHAEMNAIFNAARRGISLEGSTIYTTLEPCPSCLKGIYQAGIREVVFEQPYHDSKHVPPSAVTFWENILAGGGMSKSEELLSIRRFCLEGDSLALLRSLFKRETHPSSRGGV